MLKEDGSDQTRQIVEACDLLVSASIGYAELRAAVAAASRDGRLDQVGLRDAKDLVEAVWEGVTSIQLTDELIRAAGRYAELDHLRGYDAVHEAALLTLGQPTPDTTFACFDSALRRAVLSRGWNVFPIQAA